MIAFAAFRPAPAPEIRADATDLVIEASLNAATGTAAQTWAAGAVECCAGLWARALSVATPAPADLPIGRPGWPRRRPSCTSATRPKARSACRRRSAPWDRSIAAIPAPDDPAARQPDRHRVDARAGTARDVHDRAATDRGRLDDLGACRARPHSGRARSGMPGDTLSTLERCKLLAQQPLNKGGQVVAVTLIPRPQVSHQFLSVSED